MDGELIERGTVGFGEEFADGARVGTGGGDVDRHLSVGLYHIEAADEVLALDAFEL